jgi:hypothetical protein
MRWWAMLSWPRSKACCSPSAMIRSGTAKHESCFWTSNMSKERDKERPRYRDRSKSGLTFVFEAVARCRFGATKISANCLAQSHWRLIFWLGRRSRERSRHGEGNLWVHYVHWCAMSHSHISVPNKKDVCPQKGRFYREPVCWSLRNYPRISHILRIKLPKVSINTIMPSNYQQMTPHDER